MATAPVLTERAPPLAALPIRGCVTVRVPTGAPVAKDVNRTATGIERLADPEVLARAVTALRQALRRNPEDERARWALGEALRQKGELTEALDCYRRILRANPGHRRAGRLAAILGGSGAPPGDGEEGVRPAPFVHIARFLSDGEQDDVWSVATQGRFTSAGLVSGSGAGYIDPDHRSSRVLQTSPAFRCVKSWFRERVFAALEDAWEPLQTEPFAIGRTEVQLTSHRTGDHFGLHKDAAAGGAAAEGRRVTFVYYFHRQPRRFSGGDLLLFDTDPAQDACGRKYTRIAPSHNSILFFPSDCYHLVLPVVGESADFKDGRFTLNGWIHPAGSGTDAPEAPQEAGARRATGADASDGAGCGGSPASRRNASVSRR